MNQDFLIKFSLALLVAIITAYFADKRGRSALWWFFIGGFFGVLGLLALFLFPSKKMQEPVSVVTTVDVEPVAMEKWFYLNDDHKQFGPVTFDEIIKKHEEGELSDESYLWCEGMANWEKLSRIQKYSDTKTKP